jgi:hypothetical protein
MRTPGQLSTVHQILKGLAIAQGVHRAPKSLMPVSNELIRIYQPMERFSDELLPFAHIVEYARPHNEISAVYPYI